MKKLISEWKKGWRLLFSDDPISFYTFFTIIFAESSYLLAFKPLEISVLFGTILIGYVTNVALSSIAKLWLQDTQAEPLYTILYVLTFIILFTMGCFINIYICIIITIIPIVITALWIRLREYQRNILTYVKTDDTIDRILDYFVDEEVHNNKIILKQILYRFFQIVLVFLPFVIFAIFFKLSSIVPHFLENIALVAYVIFMPFIALLEQYVAQYNIFEMAYMTRRKAKKEQTEILKLQGNIKSEET